MNGMFNGCSSLETLPDISTQNSKKVKYKENMFKNCNKNIIPKKLFCFLIISNLMLKLIINLYFI